MLRWEDRWRGGRVQLARPSRVDQWRKSERKEGGRKSARRCGRAESVLSAGMMLSLCGPGGRWEAGGFSGAGRRALVGVGGGAYAEISQRQLLFWGVPVCDLYYGIFHEAAQPALEQRRALLVGKVWHVCLCRIGAEESGKEEKAGCRGGGLRWVMRWLWGWCLLRFVVIGRRGWITYVGEDGELGGGVVETMKVYVSV